MDNQKTMADHLQAFPEIVPQRVETAQHAMEEELDPLNQCKVVRFGDAQQIRTPTANRSMNHSELSPRHAG